MTSPQGGETPRDLMIRAALLVIASIAGAPAEAVEIAVSSNGIRIVASVSPEEARAILNPQPAGLSVLAAALLAVLTAEPRTAKALARAAGYAMGSHVYAALRELEGRGLAQKTVKGYVLRP